MKQNLFLLCGALALLSGCSDNNQPEMGTEAPETICATARALSMNAEAEHSTRAAYVATDAKGLKAVVLTTASEDNYTATYAKGTMTFDNSDAANTAVEYDASGFSGSKQLPADKSPVYACALYPGVSTDWSSISTTASYTFDGKQDVMAAPQTQIAKGGTGDGTAAAASTASFAFKHLLTKLDIKVKGATAEAATAWGAVKSITVSKVSGAATFKNKVAVTLADASAAASAFTGSASTWPVFTSYSGSAPDEAFTGKSLALTASAVDAGTTIIAPFTATNATTDLELTVVTKTTTGSDYSNTVAVKIPAGNTQGNAYTITLNFNTTAIKGTATVGGWIPKDAGVTEID